MMIKRIKTVLSRAIFGMACLLMATQVQAQDDVNKLLKDGADDGKYLLTGYLNPFIQTLSLGLNQGWYNTAKPHKVAGLDLTVTASAMYIPTSDFFYKVDNSKLNLVQLLDGPGGNEVTKPTKVPSIFGPDTQPTYHEKGSSDPDTEFQGPGGVNLKKNVGKFVPIPMATFGFGLPKSIELRFRFCPTIDLGDNSKFNLFGVGVMHDIKQYFPGIKLLPFDLSAFVGYTHMQIDANIGQDSDKDIEKDEKGVFQVNSTTIQGIISKKISVITVYGSIGYNIAKTKVALKGTYDFNDNNTADVGEVDPLTLKFAASGPRVTGGVRLKLAIFTLHADYTLQKYSSLSAGFGINIR